MSVLASYYLLIKELTREFRYLRVETKRSKWYWRLIREVLYLLSWHRFDFFKCQSSIGCVFALSDDWGEQRMAAHHKALLKHREYLRIYSKLGLGNLWVGTCVFLFLYPVMFVWIRIRERL